MRCSSLAIRGDACGATALPTCMLDGDPACGAGRHPAARKLMLWFAGMNMNERLRGKGMPEKMKSIVQRAAHMVDVDGAPMRRWMT
jgi:hypothetical protein